MFSSLAFSNPAILSLVFQPWFSVPPFSVTHPTVPSKWNGQCENSLGSFDKSAQHGANATFGVWTKPIVFSQRYAYTQLK